MPDVSGRATQGAAVSGWTGVAFSANCPAITSLDLACQVCGDPATGHATVDGGRHDGRLLAVVCPLHASEDGSAAFRARLVDWMAADLLHADGGPGADGQPEVWHGDHLDPMPEHSHGGVQP